MHEFEKRHGRLPKPWSGADAADFIHLAKEINAKSPSPVELDDAILEQVCFFIYMLTP